MTEKLENQRTGALRTSELENLLTRELESQIIRELEEITRERFTDNRTKGIERERKIQNQKIRELKLEN